MPLGALVALLGAFVATQLATLFGGNRHVLETAGLTYAEYARTGFAQMAVVAALTLVVIAAAARWARDGGGLLRALLAALCVLTLVVIASALRRLELYEEAYGFTRLRLTADAILLWLGALFVLVLAAGRVRRCLAPARRRRDHRRRRARVRAVEPRPPDRGPQPRAPRLGRQLPRGPQPGRAARARLGA